MDKENSQSGEVSMADVADFAGVSRTTVSRVINNDPRPSMKAVRKVKAAMKELGYVPKAAKNRRGPRIKHRRPRRQLQIALIASYQPYILQSSVYSKLLRSIDNEVQKEYYNMIVRHLPEHNPWDVIPAKIDGAMLFGCENLDDRFLKKVKEFPCVRIMRQPIEDDIFDHITYDGDKIGAVAAEHLIKRGRKNLVYIESPNYMRRGESFIKTAEKHGIKARTLTNNNLWVIEPNKQWVDSRVMGQIAEQIANMPERPDGIFVQSDRFIVPLHHIIQHYGFTPGGDVDLIGVNNISDLLDGLYPKPASVDINVEQIGSIAFRQLLWRMDNPKEPRTVTKLSPVISEL